MQEKARDESTANSGDAFALKIPDHELIRCIGSGAFGEVWLATATSLPGAYRAVKVVRRNSLEGEGFAREFRGIQRFEPISRAHPNLINILHVGENSAGGYFFYLMELADCATSTNEPSQDSGEPLPGGIDPATYEPRTLLHELSTRIRLPLEECVDVALSLAAGLVHLHRNGLIHRDIKPANIIFVKGVAKLADIGLVADAQSAVTFVGTSGYIAPEGPGTLQADIYSLGKVFYEMITGLDRNSFPQLPEDWAALPNRKALTKFNSIIIRACEGHVTQRYQSAEDVEADLLRLRQDLVLNPSLFAGRRNLLLGAAVISALFLASGFLGFYKWAHPRAAKNPPNVSPGTDSAGEFTLLFNGRDLSGWNAPGNNWACQDGALTRVQSGGDITYETEPLPDDFDLRFEWKVSPGGDSGVLYRPGRVEYQVLDNEMSPFGADSRTWAGSLFDYASQPEDRTRPVGQWNEGRILCEGDRIKHYLNGALVLDTDYTEPLWNDPRNRLQTKYNTDLAARGGYLVLRDEKGQVWYRNIRRKVLE